MKNLRTLILLFSFFVLMLSLTLLRISKDKKKEEKSIFDNLNISYVSAIEIINSKKHLIITNETGWKIISPFKELASVDKIQKLLTELKKLKIIYIITNFSSIEEYGFSPYIIRIKISGKDIEETVDFGFKSVDEKYRYLYNKGKLYVVEGDIEFVFEPDSFRDTTIFNISLDNITSISITYKNKKYHILKKADNYYINSKILSNFNEKMIDIYSLSIYDFLETKINKKPLYEIKLCSNEKTNSLWIYDNDIEGKWIAKSSEKEGYFLLENDDLENILKIEVK
ncbi:MAG: DUF4340 domain-containing protein [Brevinematales bacterium]|nr:DUF4340 domain-containing protein [Brevinematales bacterium]